MNAHQVVKRPRALDARLYQIASLTGLLAYGVFVLHFDVRGSRVALLLATAVLTQWICGKFWKLPAHDPRSALISGLSLCLLLRTRSSAVAVASAVIAI